MFFHSENTPKHTGILLACNSVRRECGIDKEPCGENKQKVLYSSSGPKSPAKTEPKNHVLMRSFFFLTSASTSPQSTASLSGRVPGKNPLSVRNMQRRMPSAATLLIRNCGYDLRAFVRKPTMDSIRSQNKPTPAVLQRTIQSSPREIN